VPSAFQQYCIRNQAFEAPNNAGIAGADLLGE